MLIKRPQGSGWLLSLKRLWRERLWTRVGVIVVVVVGLQAVVVLSSMYYAVQLYTAGQVNAYHEVIDQLVVAASEPGQAMVRFITGKMARPKRLTLDLDFEDWQALVAKHDEAFAERSLYASENPDVPARIRLNGKEVDVDVRLKGAPSHFMGAKWSLRVRVRDDREAVFGTKTFSLQHPETRRFLGEWIAHKMMEREGVIALQYDFVEVVINGRNRGIYAFEEHFSKELVERNGRREGPIMWMNEELYNLNRWQDVWPNEVREVDSYQTGKTVADEGLARQFMAARSLLAALKRGEMTTCEVFECELLARYFALLDLLGGEHAAESGNMKMYYNPVTARLEPIVFDVESEYTRKHLFLRTWSNYDARDSSAWIKQVFSDSEFMEQYVRELSRMVEPEYLDEFFADVEGEMAEKLTILHASYPTYNFDKQPLYEIQERIKAILEAQKALDGYVDSSTTRSVTIEVGTVLPMPVEIGGLRCAGSEIMLDKPVRLKPLVVDELIAHKRISFALPRTVAAGDCVGEELRVIYSLLGREDRREEAISLLPKEADYFSRGDLVRQKPNARSYSWISVDEASGRMVVSPGRWTVSTNLIVPAGYVLVAGPGVEINLVNGAHILSHSPIEWLGTSGSPIVITSDNGSGKGVVVLDANKQSQVSYAVFRNLSAASSEFWRLTGAVTFYQSPVQLSNVRFERNHDSDDALNVIRSEYSLDEVSFIDVASDGLDSDFSVGTIRRSRVIGAGGDGFDFSGSMAVLEEVVIEDVGDKGLSVGEQSMIEAGEVAVRGCAVAAVSKDFSDTSIIGLTIDDCAVGLALYQKKPEFGFARMSVWNVDWNNVGERFVVEEDSILALDAVSQPTTPGPVGDRF